MHTRGCEVLGVGDHGGGLSRFGGQGSNGEGLHGGSGDGELDTWPSRIFIYYQSLPRDLYLVPALFRSSEGHVASWHWPAVVTYRLEGGQPSPAPSPEPSVNGGQRRSTVAKHQSTTMSHRRTTVTLSPDHRLTITEPPVKHRSTLVYRRSTVSETGRAGSGQVSGRVATCHHRIIGQWWLTANQWCRKLVGMGRVWIRVGLPHVTTVNKNNV
nr:hypothetical protein [Tanacetum cinerariifolium]